MEMELPKPMLDGQKSLEECLYKRESIRKFKDKKIEVEKISQLLWAAQGKKGHKRICPSAGAIYPLQIYVVLKNQGIYIYNVKNHSLELKQEGEFSELLAIASLNQTFISAAPLNIIICVNFPKIRRGYGIRGDRYALIEVGHCAQNIHLECISLNLGSVPIGAFRDDEVKQILKLPEDIDPLYIIPIGY